MPHAAPPAGWERPHSATHKQAVRNQPPSLPSAGVSQSPQTSPLCDQSTSLTPANSKRRQPARTRHAIATRGWPWTPEDAGSTHLNLSPLYHLSVKLLARPICVLAPAERDKPKPLAGGRHMQQRERARAVKRRPCGRRRAHVQAATRASGGHSLGC